MMPSLFVAHGAPTLALERSEYTEFLRGLAERLPVKPSGIVLFSARWQDRMQQVSGVLNYETMYDFAGYPEELHRLRYPARGDLTLSLAVQELLREEGIPCEENDARGLDHGAWGPLTHMFPQADVPVVTVSVNSRLTAEEQYRIGSALAPLRAQHVLIIGSGGTVHNQRRFSEPGEGIVGISGSGNGSGSVSDHGSTNGGGSGDEAGVKRECGYDEKVGEDKGDHGGKNEAENGAAEEIRNSRTHIGDGGAADRAVLFEEWLGEQIETWNMEALFDYERRAPFAREAVPEPEHLVPLLIAMGAADGDGEAELLHSEYRDDGAMALTCWQFGGGGTGTR